MAGDERRVAIVTAASRGIGAGCARALAAKGYRVALMSRSDDATALAGELSGIAVRGSVAEGPDLERLVETALKEYGRIDAVVNNSGHPAKGDLLAIDDAAWAEGFDLILRNVVRMARLTTPIFLRQGRGAVVNISSLWAVEPNLDAPVSSTLRAALSAFTKLYADRYASHGIRMNCLLPGFVDTHPVPEHFARAIPTGRPASADEIGRIAAFLLSDEAGYITGQSLRADGGLTRSI